MIARRRATSAAVVIAYLLITLAPLALIYISHTPGDGFVHNLSVGLGFIGLSVLGLQLAAGGRRAWATTRFGNDAVLRFHRQMAVLAVLAVYGHPVLLYLRGEPGLLDVLHGELRLRLAWLATSAVSILIVTAMCRRALRLSYPAWHFWHLVLGVVAFLAALGHAYLVHGYTAQPTVHALWLGYAAAFGWLVIYDRIIRPIHLWRRSWVVTALHPEPGNGLTITLRPRQRQHGSSRREFRAGQFAWLLAGRSPFSLSYHPFSLSSSALDKNRLEFTIKRAGGFTNSLRQLSVGDRVYLDGPHGSFTLEGHPSSGYVFLAAGAGVTPFLSILATLADRRDKRPIMLLLGNRSERGITGIRQLHGLQNRLNLTVVHVVSQPGSTWTGERGRITADTLAFYLDHSGCRRLDCQPLEFFVCASPRVATAYRKALRHLGVPASRIHSEQF